MKRTCSSDKLSGRELPLDGLSSLPGRHHGHWLQGRDERRSPGAALSGRGGLLQGERSQAGLPSQGQLWRGARHLGTLPDGINMRRFTRDNK